MSEIKVNKISPRTNCGTVTLGDSGDTFTIPSGATITNSGTATGFGATGAVNWQTSIKTAGFVAVSGEGYFVDTTSGSITVTLPSSPSVGNIVAIKDYGNISGTNDIVIGRNSSNIEGSALDFKVNTNGESVTLIYADSTKGWLVVNDGNKSAIAIDSDFIIATGGTVTTVCTNFKVHTFTGPGSFVVCAAGTPCGSNTVDYMVVGGGGGGGASCGGGGGGAGGFRQSSGAATGCYAVSPLGSGVAALPVTATTFPITVGAGGAANTNGGDSIFAGTTTVTSAGGGAGKGFGTTGGSGGSGGGGGGRNNTGGGSGNTPSVSPPQGQNGGNAAPGGSPPTIDAGGAGGGAGGAGSNAANCTGRAGGVGVPTAITGSALSYSGGGGSSAESGTHGAASPCGTGGAGGNPGSNGTTNRGGGGGGVHSGTAGLGGSGVVIIRYKFQ